MIDFVYYKKELEIAHNRVLECDKRRVEYFYSIEKTPDYIYEDLKQAVAIECNIVNEFKNILLKYFPYNKNNDVIFTEAWNKSFYNETVNLLDVFKYFKEYNEMLNETC